MREDRLSMSIRLWTGFIAHRTNSLMAEPPAKLQPQFGRKRILVDIIRRGGILIDRHTLAAGNGLVASFHFSFLHRCAL